MIIAGQSGCQNCSRVLVQYSCVRLVLMTVSSKEYGTVACLTCALGLGDKVHLPGTLH